MIKSQVITRLNFIIKSFNMILENILEDIEYMDVVKKDVEALEGAIELLKEEKC